VNHRRSAIIFAFRAKIVRNLLPKLIPIALLFAPAVCLAQAYTMTTIAGAGISLAQLPALQVSIAGTQAQVTYDGLAPGAVGLYQINLTVNNAFTLGGVPGTQRATPRFSKPACPRQAEHADRRFEVRLWNG